MRFLNPIKWRITMGYDYTFKILLLGDSSSGKVEFLNRYISGFFLDDLRLTTGVDFYSKTTNFSGKKIKLQLWIFGGEKRFRFLLHQYFKGANGAIIMYDITNLKSLESLPERTRILREHTGDIPILLVGNKLDLEKSRVVPKEEGVLTAKKYSLSACVEVSSKTGKNVEKVFEALTSLMLANEGYQIDQGEELLSMEVKDPLPDMRYSKNFIRDKGDIKFLEEKLNRFGDLVERMMAEILRIPYLVDQSFATVNQKLSTLESRIKDLKKKRDENDDETPYPYIFKPPEPPGDFAMAPQLQIHTPLKEKDYKDKINCQFCGMELTKENQFTHSCNRFFLG